MSRNVETLILYLKENIIYFITCSLVYYLVNNFCPIESEVNTSINGFPSKATILSSHHSTRTTSSVLPAVASKPVVKLAVESGDTERATVSKK